METACPGCGVVLPEREGPAHAYLGASAACWAFFGEEILAREFGDAAFFGSHQLTVDAYAVQHPGEPGRRQIQSVGLHLMTLCLFLERGFSPAEGPRLHRKIVGRPEFHWLEPPVPNGTITVRDVAGARDGEEHARRLTTWAEDVWAAWTPHHETVRGWLEQIDPSVRLKEP